MVFAQQRYHGCRYRDVGQCNVNEDLERERGSIIQEETGKCDLSMAVYISK